MFSPEKIKEIEIDWRSETELSKTDFNGCCFHHSSCKQINFLDFKNQNIADVIKKVESDFSENLMFITSSYYGDREQEVRNALKELGYKIKSSSARMFLKEEKDFPVINYNLDLEFRKMENSLDDYIYSFTNSFINSVNVPSINYIEKLRSMKLSDKNQAFVLYDGDKPIGTIRLKIYNKIATVEDVGIIRKYQHQHLGNKLMEFIIGLSKKTSDFPLGLSTTIGENGEKNYVNFYNRCGFETEYVITRWIKE